MRESTHLQNCISLFASKTRRSSVWVNLHVIFFPSSLPLFPTCPKHYRNVFIRDDQTDKASGRICIPSFSFSSSCSCTFFSLCTSCSLGRWLLQNCKIRFLQTLPHSFHATMSLVILLCLRCSLTTPDLFDKKHPNPIQFLWLYTLLIIQ